jgi:hypothetical protein
MCQADRARKRAIISEVATRHACACQTVQFGSSIVFTAGQRTGSTLTLTYCTNWLTTRTVNTMSATICGQYDRDLSGIIKVTL